MIIKNVRIFTEEQRFVPGVIRTEGDRIAEVQFEDDALTESGSVDEKILDGKGAYCFPGMVDLHFHGCMGADFCDGTEEAVHTLAEYEAGIGVTSIAPATMTLSMEELKAVLKNGAAFRKKQEKGEYRDCAELCGINMEGPFISPAKKGAQDAAYILKADPEIYREFEEASEGLVKIIGIAPEEGNPGSVRAYIEEVSKRCVVSLAHTNASYESARMAFEAGASHLVHTWNAMTSFSHRAPGVIPAAAEADHVNAEMICDGIHVHPSVIRATFRLFGPERMVLISDSMRAAGLTDGIYTLGGQDVQVRGNLATMISDGAIAGSVTTLPDCVRYAVRTAGIPLEQALAAATVNPARVLKIDEEYGKIRSGYKANLVLWDEELRLISVIKDGVCIRKK